MEEAAREAESDIVARLEQQGATIVSEDMTGPHTVTVQLSDRREPISGEGPNRLAALADVERLLGGEDAPSAPDVTRGR